MEEKWDARTEILIGKEANQKLQKAKVIVYGIGGVGSYVVEGLARAGIGQFILVDNETISQSNRNRQIHSNINTVGKDKVEVMKNRILEINPIAKIETYKPEKGEPEQLKIDETISYVVDAIDTIPVKIQLVMRAKEIGVPIISAMGAGNKLDPTQFEVADLYQTTVCPLAKVMRKELKNKGVKRLKVVYSKEQPIVAKKEFFVNNQKKQVNGSISFVPSVMGFIIAGEVIKDIMTQS